MPIANGTQWLTIAALKILIRWLPFDAPKTLSAAVLRICINPLKQRSAFLQPLFSGIVVPNLSEGKSGWLGLVDLGAEDLPPVDVSQCNADLPPGETDQENYQDRKTFATEAERIVQSPRTIQWHQPSRHEVSDEDASTAESAAAVFVEDDVDKPEALGGPLRASILHKLMEEVLTGEIADDIKSLKARAAELLIQLGEVPAEDPSKGPVPSELVQVVANTFSLREASVLRDRLSAEFPVFGHHRDAGEPEKENALFGVSDAIAVDSNGGVEVVVDWKSDVGVDYRH